MALPIAATPVLKGKDAADFLRTIANDLKSPAKMIPTPKLGHARELISKYAASRKK